MNRTEFEQIADAMLAGTASTTERERFMAHIASDPEAGQIWSDLRIAHSVLSNAELEPAPAGLRGEILQSVRSFQRPKNKFWSEIFAPFRARPALAYGMTFAVGLAVGILALGAVRGGFEAGRELAPSTVATLPAHPEAAAPVAIEVGGAGVEVTASKIADGATVTIAGRQGNADVILDWDPQIHALAHQGGSGELVSTASGRVVIRMTPDSKWTVVLRASGSDGADLRVTVRSGGSEGSHTLHLPG